MKSRVFLASCEVISIGKPKEVGFGSTVDLDEEAGIAEKTSNYFPVVKGGVRRIRDGSLEAPI